MRTAATSPETIRANAFAALESDMADVRLLALSTSFITEELLVNRAKSGQHVTLSNDNAQSLDFIVHELIRRVDGISEKWRDAHNAACDAERDEGTR